MEIPELDRITDIIRRYLEDEARRPALESLPPSRICDEVDLRIPVEGRPVDEVYRLAEAVAMRTPRTGSRKFFNQLFGGRFLPAVAGEMLAAVLNSSMYTYKVAGIQVLVEQEVIRTFCSLVGFEKGDGTLVPGGSLSNLAAMIMARNRKRESARDQGLAGERLTAYVSDQSHYSLVKNAGLCGTGRRNVRRIASDDRGRLRVEALTAAIEADLAEGNVPFFLCATAGTTVLGAFDPIEEMAEVAGRYDLWFHVDGAFGGSLLLSREHRSWLNGCERADSFSWNAHKMMNVPLSASAILVREAGTLQRHFSEDAHYLFQADTDDLNPGHKSLQCGRRNDALKVWLAFQAIGLRGYEQRIRRLFELTRYTRDRIVADELLELELEPESVTVCFHVPAVPSDEICAALDKRGRGKVGFGTFRGRTFIRLVLVDPEITPADIDAFLGDLKQVARQLR